MSWTEIDSGTWATIKRAFVGVPGWTVGYCDVRKTGAKEPVMYWTSEAHGGFETVTRCFIRSDVYDRWTRRGNMAEEIKPVVTPLDRRFGYATGRYSGD